MKLVKWTARRSGDSITITGTDDKGEGIRLPAIDYVASGASGPFALGKDGTKHELS